MEENIITKWAKERKICGVNVYYNEIVERDLYTIEYWGFKITCDCVSYNDLKHLQKLTDAQHIIINPTKEGNLDITVDIFIDK